MDHLNYFNPYESKKPWHEDQLTRAFLVVLRLVPLAHAFFLDLVRDAHTRNGSQQTIPPLSAISWKTVTIQTQTGTINQVGGRLISIVMTDDHWTGSADIQVSKRGARYDGVLSYEPEWILVIENKPFNNIWEDQLNPNLPDSTDILVDKKAVNLRWRDVIAGMSSLRERKLLQGTEGLIVDDFLQFIEKEFSYLNPFNTIAVCKGDTYLLQKRCKGILEEIVGRQETITADGDRIRIPFGPARQVYLVPDKAEDGEIDILLRLHPGDTINQAREFFSAVDKAAFLMLEENGWSIWPNMHFSFMATNLVWSKFKKLSLEQYIDYWSQRTTAIQQVQRGDDGFKKYFSELLRVNIISEEDVFELEQHFARTKRNSINPCPGFSIEYSWNLLEAGRLDRDRRFAEVVKAHIDQAMLSWGQRI